MGQLNARRNLSGSVSGSGSLLCFLILLEDMAFRYCSSPINTFFGLPLLLPLTYVCAAFGIFHRSDSTKEVETNYVFFNRLLETKCLKIWLKMSSVRVDFIGSVFSSLGSASRIWIY